MCQWSVMCTTVYSDRLEKTANRTLNKSAYSSYSYSFVYSFRYSTSRVLTVLLDSKCSHYYGCEAWDLNQSQTIHIFAVSWKKATRKVWCLPPDSHISYLAGLNNDNNALDKIYAKSVTMIHKMAISKSTQMCYLVNNSFNDQKRLMQCNFNIISKSWGT